MLRTTSGKPIMAAAAGTDLLVQWMLPAGEVVAELEAGWTAMQKRNELSLPWRLYMRT